MKENLIAFSRLIILMNELREQCPWDKKQTMESLRYLTIEEMYELSDAILEKDMEEIKKELGDLLLHIVHSNHHQMILYEDVCNKNIQKINEK